jgi:hypothetical protein
MYETEARDALKVVRWESQDTIVDKLHVDGQFERRCQLDVLGRG